jgi:hypothetical protein
MTATNCKKQSDNDFSPPDQQLIRELYADALKKIQAAAKFRSGNIDNPTARKGNL